MKKLLLSAALFVAFAGVATGSSINGDYNGNPIVKVRVNGNEIKPEVPAQIINGSTLLPLRAVSESLGANVTWNPDNYSVDVNLPTPSNYTIKLYSKIQHQYFLIYNLSNVSLVVNQAMSMSLQNSSYLSTANNYLNQYINDYNSTLQEENNLVAIANPEIISDMNVMLSQFNNSINYYKSAYDSLSKYAISGSYSDSQNFLSNNSNALQATNSAGIQAETKFLDEYNIIQNSNW